MKTAEEIRKEMALTFQSRAEKWIKDAEVKIEKQYKSGFRTATFPNISEAEMWDIVKKTVEQYGYKIARTSSGCSGYQITISW